MVLLFGSDVRNPVEGSVEEQESLRSI